MKGNKLILVITAVVLVLALGISGVLIYFANQDEPKKPTVSKEKEETPTSTEAPVETYEQRVENMKKELDNMKNLNGGVLPLIALDSKTSVPNFIVGTYSDKNVSNFSDARGTLQDVKSIMGIQNAENEYAEAETFTFDGTTQYRMQQMYGEYAVYGQQLVVTADEAGKVTSLSGDYATIGTLFDSSINLDENEARQNAQAAGMMSTTQAGISLVAYTLDGYREMAYVLNSDTETYIVSAKDGAILSKQTHIMTALPSDINSSNAGTITQTIGRDENNYSDNTFNTAYYDYTSGSQTDTYYFYDQVRDIVYHDRQMNDWNDWNDIVTMLPMADSDNIWTSESSRKAVTLYKNLSSTYDFYLEVLGLKSYDGNGGQILAYINDGYDNGNNAFNWGPNPLNADSFDTGMSDRVVTIISFGGNRNYQDNLGVVGHEFTHAVQGALIRGIRYRGQTGALMEAYSDVMGELIEAYYDDYKQTDWVHGERNIKSPSSAYSDYYGMNYPKKYQGAGYYNGESDGGGVHHNSTVISHVVYKIYSSGLQDIPTLTELLYRSWGYLTESASFYDYRSAMLAAAKVMGMNEETIGWITKAFNEADITPDSIPDDYENYFENSVTVSCSVADAVTREPIAGAEIAVYTVGRRPYEVARVHTQEDGTVSFGLAAGEYSVVVTATGYQENKFVQVFNFGEDGNISCFLQSDDYQEEEVKCELGGITTDALTGYTLGNVTMNFRKGYNITSGSVDLVLYSDENGNFKTDALEYGFYTIELQKEGYITSYVLAQAAASNWEESEREDALNQNFSISPRLQMDDTLRIVLTWGADPSDLDSHLIGPVSGGAQFHVYYVNKEAYDNGERVVMLDVDDTTSYGPETTTLSTINDSELYHYYVHDYSNKGSEENRELAASGARVQVFSGSRLIATYEVPTDGIGTVWHVFDYDPVNGNLIPIHEFVSESEIDMDYY